MRRRFIRVLAPLALPYLALIAAISTGPAAAQQRTLCVQGLEAPQALMVRSGPGLDSRVIGRLPAKACGVRLAGRCNGEWCEMALGETLG